jgi:hypothetical protein
VEKCCGLFGESGWPWGDWLVGGGGGVKVEGPEDDPMMGRNI